MPAVPGAIYSITSYISSWVGTNATQAGSDATTSTTTILTIDNLSPSAPSSITGTKTATEQMILSYTNATTADATTTLVLRSTTLTTDTPVEGTSYTVGNTIGASTVTCVKNSITLGAADSCTYTTPSRSTNYYFRLFTQDITGNYSQAATPSNQPLLIQGLTGKTFFYTEAEVSNGATTTVGGGTGEGGGSGNGSSTNATTTVGGGSGQGGGSGDSGFLYFKSNLAFLRYLNKTLGDLVEVVLTHGSYSTYAAGEKFPLEKGNRCPVYKVPYFNKFYVRYADISKGCSSSTLNQ
jgi:uncharacterized membrane protein YgcG